MNPDIQQLQEQVAELMEWKAEKERQQITYPLDEASKTGSGALFKAGVGTKALTQVVTDSHGDTVTVPAAYAGTRLIRVEGEQIEIPYL